METIFFKRRIGEHWFQKPDILFSFLIIFLTYKNFVRSPIDAFIFPFLHWLSAITPDTALSLEGKGRLDYHMSQNEKREYLLRQSIRGAMLEPFGVNSLEIKFRTRSENGILIHIQESSNYTTVKVR